LRQPFDGFALHARDSFRGEKVSSFKRKTAAGQVSRLLRKCRARKQILKLRELFRSFLNRQMPNHPRKKSLFRCHWSWWSTFSLI